MQEINKKNSFPITLGIISALAFACLGCFLFPEAAKILLKKEGAIEHLSHFILFVSLLLLGACLLSKKAHCGNFLLLLLLFIILMEETDWGAIYGLPTIKIFLVSRFHADNLHNFRYSFSFIKDSYQVFGWLFLLYFMIQIPSLNFLKKIRQSFFPCNPSKDEISGFFTVISVNFICDMTIGAWNRYLEEIFETSVYFIFFVIITRSYFRLKKLDHCSASSNKKTS